MTLPFHISGLVLAAEGQGGLLDPQPGLSFWFLITFVIVALVLRWKVWGPLSHTIEAREKSINDAIDQAKKEREQAEQLLSDQKVAMAEARRDMAEQIRKNQAEVEKAKEAQLLEVRVQADNLLRDARKQIEEEKRKALDEVRHVAVNLAIEAASKLLVHKLDDSMHRALAEDFVADIQKNVPRAKVVA